MIYDYPNMTIRHDYTVELSGPTNYNNIICIQYRLRSIYIYTYIYIYVSIYTYTYSVETNIHVS